jgi:hypothetical protein
MSAIKYRSADVGGLKVFYREAGRADAPALLLLHGFPSASHMFRDLIPLLADRFHIIAPDLPGFGQSEMPTRSKFTYTFDHIAGVIDRFTEVVGLKRFAIYVFDYGAPVGFRIATKHPDRVTSSRLETWCRWKHVTSICLRRRKTSLAGSGYCELKHDKALNMGPRRNPRKTEDQRTVHTLGLHQQIDQSRPQITIRNASEGLGNDRLLSRGQRGVDPARHPSGPGASLFLGGHPRGIRGPARVGEICVSAGRDRGGARHVPQSG